MLIVATTILIFCGLYALNQSGCHRGIADVAGIPMWRYEGEFVLGRIFLVGASVCIGYALDGYGMTTLGLIIPFAMMGIVGFTNLPNWFASRAHLDSWEAFERDSQTYLGVTDYALIVSGVAVLFSLGWLVLN